MEGTGHDSPFLHFTGLDDSFFWPYLPVGNSPFYVNAGLDEEAAIWSKATKRKRSQNREALVFGEIIESVAIAVILAVVIRLFILEPFYIPSGSMEPNLRKMTDYCK